MKSAKAYGYSKYGTKEIKYREKKLDDYENEDFPISTLHNGGVNVHKHPHKKHPSLFEDEEQFSCNDNRTNRLLISRQQNRRW